MNGRSWAEAYVIRFPRLKEASGGLVITPFHVIWQRITCFKHVSIFSLYQCRMLDLVKFPSWLQNILEDVAIS
jgi:hypothetical protein